MACTVTRQRLPVFPAGLDPEVVVLSDGAGGEAVLWPALGFNCIRWTSVWQGKSLNLVHQDPDLMAGSPPTRSGNPILFPFPNRIRGGAFQWAGRPFKLPLNGDHGTSAIHGFACRNPWQVIATGAGAEEAFVTAEYHGFRDQPETQFLWPADHILRVTCRLRAGRLAFEAQVINPDTRDLPFGLGYHPYFSAVWHDSLKDSLLQIRVPATSAWELEHCLPTGIISPLPPGRSLQQWKDIPGLQLDDVLTGLPGGHLDTHGLSECGALRHANGGPTLTVKADPIFQHVVVFTPGDRASVCIEPYTCVTDAPHMRGRGLPDGLLELQPSGSFRAVMAWEIT